MIRPPKPGGAYLDVGSPQQALLCGSGGITARFNEGSLEMAGQVLIQLDSHDAVIFQTFSRASSAA